MLEPSTVQQSAPTLANRPQKMLRRQEGNTEPSVEKIRVILANHAHLDRFVDEAFLAARRELAQQDDLALATAAISGTSVTTHDHFIDLAGAIRLVTQILERVQLTFELTHVEAWVATACSTFALSKSEAQIITASRARCIVDWVLQCLGEHMIRMCPTTYFQRKFLIGFDHNTSIAASGLQLSGPVAHGMFGNIWLQAKYKRAWERQHSLNGGMGDAKIISLRRSNLPNLQNVRSSNVAIGGMRQGESPGKTPCLPGLASLSPRTSAITSRNTYPPPDARAGNSTGRHVVYSISKSLCKLPPALLSARLLEMIGADPLPYVLPLVDAFEDLAHIHLVYESLAADAICLVDKIFCDMHQVSHERHGAGGLCERDVQSVVWRLMSMLKQAHGRGLVHGCLRMGCCFLNDHDQMDSLKILEFGLSQLFAFPVAAPPLAVLTPLDSDPADPVPPYRIDFQCVAEMLYLMLGGQPLCSADSSLEERRQRFRWGTVPFTDKVFTRTSESAKDFTLELLRPVQFKRATKLPPCHEATKLMAHGWFFPSTEMAAQMDEVFDIIVMRKYDNWRNTLRLQTNLMKLVADRMTIGRLEDLRKDLSTIAGTCGKISWVQLSHGLLQRCLIPIDLLKKVSKAFGDNVHERHIHIDNFCTCAIGWRRKRVQEIIWQVFNRSHAYNGVLPAQAVMDGLTSSVLYVWSRPSRVLEVVFPLMDLQGSSESEITAKVEELVRSNKTVSCLDLLARTDAANPL